MRQGQQNRRGRGRNNNNNNRKPQNPLTRSFESNGPDVKIRGTPAHIAEKYISLARDAQSSGDPVLAENYLQHAEHYNRIILSFREQGQGSDVGANGRPRNSDQFGPGDDFGDDDGDDYGSDMSVMSPGEPQPSVRSSEGGERHPHEHQPAPRQERQERPERHRQDNRGFSGEQRQMRDRGDRNDRQFDRQDRPERIDRSPERADRPDRPERIDRSDRPERPERPDRPERIDRSPERVDRPDRPERIERQDRPVNGGSHAFEGERPAQQRAVEPRGESRGDAPRRRERARFGESGDQPDFLRRPVRRPRREAQGEEPVAPAADQTVSTAVDDPQD